MFVNERTGQRFKPPSLDVPPDLRDRPSGQGLRLAAPKSRHMAAEERERRLQVRVILRGDRLGRGHVDVIWPTRSWLTAAISYHLQGMSQREH